MLKVCSLSALDLGNGCFLLHRTMALPRGISTALASPASGIPLDPYQCRCKDGNGFLELLVPGCLTFSVASVRHPPLTIRMLNPKEHPNQSPLSQHSKREQVLTASPEVRPEGQNVRT